LHFSFSFGKRVKVIHKLSAGWHSRISVYLPAEKNTSSLLSKPQNNNNNNNNIVDRRAKTNSWKKYIIVLAQFCFL
jgi:hypothetical protein